MTADETQQVLEMLASGTITPDQAEDLLDALRADSPAPVPVVNDHNPRSRGRRIHTKKSVRPTVAALAEAAMFGVDAEFIRSLEQAGYRELSLSELTELAKFAADGEFVRSLDAAGYRGLSANDLVELATFDVNGEFVERMRGAGLTELSVGELIELGRSGADEEAIRLLRRLGPMDDGAHSDTTIHAEDEESDAEEER